MRKVVCCGRDNTMQKTLQLLLWEFGRLVLAFCGFFIIGGWSAAAHPQADDRMSFGRHALDDAIVKCHLKTAVKVQVTGSGSPESYTITFKKGSAVISASDTAGALYGSLELAERILRRGKAAMTGPTVTGSPFLRDRGWNLFLTLPWNYAAANTDYDPQALVDSSRWFFANDRFWQTLFDQMAYARLNWLDIHGTWDISVTDAPNLYAYFIQSAQFPKVGVAPEIKAANLRQLKKIIRLAHARGIRVSLMAYEAQFHTPHAPEPYPENEDDLYLYTREAVEKMIRQVPELDAIGFRIGESGHGESFFKCYGEAVRASGRDIPLITRSWIARKSQVVPLAKSCRDFTVEIKFNGEQWGAPYMVMGGRMAGWYSYSFEDYLSDSQVPDAVRLWPGGPVAGGSRWPDEPYKIVWQVRANGTHRIFPIYNPDGVRSTVRSMSVGTASGFVVEGIDTYYPKSPRYYLADSSDAFCDWIHERDWMFLNLWGRLGYDPNTPDDVFDAMVADKFGNAAPGLVAAWKAAGRILLTAYSSFSLGPDHRNHAIELEWGGNTDDYIAGFPFDSHVFKSVREALADGTTGGSDGRISALETAALLQSDASVAEQASEIAPSSVPQSERKRFKEIVVACEQAAHLGRYYAARFLSAYRAAQAQGGVSGAAGHSTYYMQEAEKEWGALAACSFYKPFTERLRMRTNTFHWSQELPKLKAETERLSRIAAPIPDTVAPIPARPSLPSIALETGLDKFKISIPAEKLTRAWALVKPLPSSAFFHKMAMTRQGDRFGLELPRENWGHAVAAEVEHEGRIDRIPGLEGNAPYLVIPSKAGPTPLLYSSEEALTYLNADVLSPSKYGLLLIASRALNFHRDFLTPVQRKVLDPVKRGMTLIVLAQDYTSSRYTLDWLPKSLGVETRPGRVFDPAGLLGMSRIEGDDIIRQRFVASPGWDVSADGGEAVLHWGMGRIILINARLLERLHVAGCAAELETVLASGGREKPVVVVDAGTEGGVYTSSLVTDFMNSHNIPFLTLGEVIAQTQGVNAAKPISGRLDDDDVLASLNIRGDRMVNNVLENKVKAAAALPAPVSREDFERRRIAQKTELMRSLGLDPLPARTPLHAKVTGVLQRHGYRIEKIVYESRPDFPVTGHLYIPDGVAGKKLPVIVNPHGHWEWKKQEPTVQARLIAQALHGYLAFIIDSPGFSFEGDNHVERRFAGTHDDLRLTLGSQNATSVYVWDLIRALDYLETRPEADMSKVGLTGASGGGLATMWAFAAEPRFTCAASVVFASSLEINPHNGCLCNHVPGSLQIGDRADVLGLRAPAPVLIIGAEEDREFPAKGMRLSGDKLRRLWGLFGKSDDAWLRMFPGGHDYNQPMRETALGFFDKYLKGVGDGSPVPEPALSTETPDSPELYALPDVPQHTLTMRGIAQGMFSRPPTDATVSNWIQLNGGLPEAIALDVKTVEEVEGKSSSTFISESGLTVPAIFWPARGDERAIAVLISENGKAAAFDEYGVERLRESGISCLAIDPRGLGELKGLDLRLATYLGQAPYFGMAWDIARSVAAFIPSGKRVAVVGRGPTAGAAALAAALIEPRVGFVAGLATLREFNDAFRDDVPLLALQPRANYAPPLSRLRSLVKAETVWSFLGESEPNWVEALIHWARQ